MANLLSLIFDDRSCVSDLWWPILFYWSLMAEPWHLNFDDRCYVSDLWWPVLCFWSCASFSMYRTYCRKIFYSNAFLTLFVALSHWRYGCNMHGKYAEFFEGIVFEIHLSFLTLHFSDGLYRCHTLKYITWYLLLAIYGRYGTDVRMKRRVNGRIYGRNNRILTDEPTEWNGQIYKKMGEWTDLRTQ